VYPRGNVKESQFARKRNALGSQLANRKIEPLLIHDTWHVLNSLAFSHNLANRNAGRFVVSDNYEGGSVRRASNKFLQ